MTLDKELIRFSRLIRKYARDDADVEQACRLAVWREIEHYNPASGRSFEYGVLMRIKQYANRERHRVFNAIRVPTRLVGFITHEYSTDEVLPDPCSTYDEVVMRDWVESLPKRVRRIIELRLQDKSWDEIAEEVGGSREKVRLEARTAYLKSFPSTHTV